MPPGKPVECLRVGNTRAWIVRDEKIHAALIDDKRLNRGASHGVVRRIFGENTVFLQPGGPAHGRKKTEIKNGLNKTRIERMLPGIAILAQETVDTLLAASNAPVNMGKQVTQYLFQVAALAMTGRPVDLNDEVENFQKAVRVMVDVASSTLRMALSSFSDKLSIYLSKGGRSAGRSLFEIGRHLLLAGSRNPEPNLARQMLERHAVDPSTVGPDTEFPEELLYDISMSFATAILTTSNLVLSVMDDYSRNPVALASLRSSVAEDFPDGIGGIHRLPNNPSTRMLLLAMLKGSPIDIVARDAVEALTLSDDNGGTYSVHAGDMILFDMPTIQKKCLAHLQERMEAQPPTASILDLLDFRNNDVVTVFFGGVFQCPGRFLAMTDAMLLLLPMLARLDTAWVTDQPIKHSLVNHFRGCPFMNVRPVVSPVEDLLEEQLHGARGVEVDVIRPGVRSASLPVVGGLPLRRPLSSRMSV